MVRVGVGRNKIKLVHSSQRGVDGYEGLARESLKKNLEMLVGERSLQTIKKKLELEKNILERNKWIYKIRIRKLE